MKRAFAKQFLGERTFKQEYRRDGIESDSNKKTWKFYGHMDLLDYFYMTTYSATGAIRTDLGDVTGITGGTDGAGFQLNQKFQFYKTGVDYIFTNIEQFPLDRDWETVQY